MEMNEAIEKLKSEDVETRKIAIESLNNVADEEAISPLIEATTDENSKVRFTAAKILGKMGDIACDILIEKFNEESGQNKRFLALALQESGSEKAIDCFAEVVEDDDFGVRKVAIRALGELKAHDKIDAIAKGLDDDDWGVRLATVYALGDLASEESIALIKKARRQEKDKDFKKSCNKTLKKAQKNMSGGGNAKKSSGKPLKTIKDMEKENIDEAIKEYEVYVSEESSKDVPYKRLAIIYRKKKDLNNEVRVLNAAIDNLSKKNPGKEEWFKSRLEKLD
ncbi:HEAT repeat domain-containing protein [Methanobrevibacter sp. OttesenSCG-928-K11]|nr:HEAT repeat domain-containing protein [Methanobrevibacter sp. OttesenSCG-928-K11]MDL2270577.1 HEAT repeat domain-containing protein [Methanobrevibacter sp. OttesenSCG-928-I08]